jgi:hypothetical protein
LPAAEALWRVRDLFAEHLLPSGNLEIAEGCAAVFSRWLDFAESWPPPLIRELASRYSWALEHRVAPLYPHAARFATAIHGTVLDGVVILLDCGLLVSVDVFLEDPASVSLLPLISVLLSAAADAGRAALAGMSALASAVVAIFVSGGFTFPVIADAIECYHRAALLEPHAFDFLLDSRVISVFSGYLKEADFQVRVATGRCIFAAIAHCGSPMARALFATHVMCDVLVLFDSDSPQLLVEMLRAMGTALEIVNSCGLVQYHFFNEFEAQFALVIQRLLTCECGAVRGAAVEIASANFPDVQYAPEEL